MIFCDKLNMRRKECVVSDRDAAPVHEGASEINEHPLANPDIPPEIGIERWVEVEVLADRLSRDPEEIVPHSRRIADRGVQLLYHPLCICNDVFDLSVIRVIHRHRDAGAVSCKNIIHFPSKK